MINAILSSLIIKLGIKTEVGISSNSPFHMIYRKFQSMVDKEIHVANDKTIEEIDIFLTSRVGHENY